MSPRSAPPWGSLLVLALAVLNSLPASAQLLSCASIAQCTSCAARRVGSVTRLFCSACQAGYDVAADQRSCWCSPGFYWNSTSSTCGPCGIGAWWVAPQARRALRGAHAAAATTQHPRTRRQRGASRIAGDGGCNQNGLPWTCRQRFPSRRHSRLVCTRHTCETGARAAPSAPRVCATRAAPT